ncbi:RHS repeat domain-containing protein [Brevibacillus sp. B_LB10_24]|uniref:RHS repeat domain-containing protein n=1 Tax=Brevibacillus sp. B_LB10_24 TaxID=3380645 RepID=UPI0038BA38D7
MNRYAFFKVMLICVLLLTSFPMGITYGQQVQREQTGHISPDTQAEPADTREWLQHHQDTLSDQAESAEPPTDSEEEVENVPNQSLDTDQVQDGTQATDGVAAPSAENPDLKYSAKELPYQYRRSNTDAPVDDLYRTANITENDLVLEGKHGLDLVLKRSYSSLDGLLDKPYTTKRGKNETETADREYQDEHNAPNGWSFNFPKLERYFKTDVLCDYNEQTPAYSCKDERGALRYVFTLDDGTVLEREGDKWVNYPYEGATLVRMKDNYPYISARLDINGNSYDFSLEDVPVGHGEYETVQVIKKTNAYGDQIVYRIPNYNADIEITDSAGRLIVLEKEMSYNTVKRIKVYSDTKRSQLLKHTEYVSGNTSFSSRRIWTLNQVREWDTQGKAYKTVAEYAYYDPSLYGKSEFNLLANYGFAAPNKTIALDFEGKESSAYIRQDDSGKSYLYYLLLKQVTYPVEGLSLNYTYSTYDQQNPDPFQRGVVRLYHDDKVLTYTSYHPVTAVQYRYKKTPNPLQPGSPEEWYSDTVSYPVTTNEIWKNQKEGHFRLANAQNRDGHLVVSRTISSYQSNVETTYEFNQDKNPLIRLVKNYIKEGRDSEAISGRLNLLEGDKEYLYRPVQYTSYTYENRSKKPKYVYHFLGRPSWLTADSEVYQYLLWPDLKGLTPDISSKIPKYANTETYEYNSFGDVTKEIDARGNLTTWEYTGAVTNNLRLPTRLTKQSPADDEYFHRETYEYTSEHLLKKETIQDSYPTEQGTATERTERAYTYENKRVASVSETSYGASSKTLTQNMLSYDAYGIYPTNIQMRVETAPGTFADVTVKTTYDPLGRITSQTYPDQSEVSYDYDLLGRLRTESFANQGEARTIEYKYDDSARKVTQLMPDGTEYLTQFTPFGEVEYQGQKAPGSTSIRHLLYNAYRANGRQLEASYPNARTDKRTEYVYNEDGSLWKTIDPVGITYYERANALEDATHYLPQDTVRVTAVNGLITTTYADRYQAVEKEAARTGDGSQTLVTTYRRDAFGQPVEKVVTDQTGENRVWNYRYNLKNSLVYLKDPEGQTYRYGYDSLGNLETVRENGTLTTRYTYNALSWKLSEEDIPGQKNETYTYNLTGDVKVYRDKNGNTFHYSYTPFYDVSRVEVKNPSGSLLNTQTKEYYAHTSLLKAETDSNGSGSANVRELRYTYDPFQRLSGIQSFGRYYQIKYKDDDDLIDELVYPDGTQVRYTYDAVGRIQQVFSPQMGTVTYDYNVSLDGEIQTLLYPNGIKLEHRMDSFGQMREVSHRQNVPVIWKETNEYQFGNVISANRNGTVFSYRYDKVDRLKGETKPTGDASYTYDERGNRKTFSGTVNPPVGNTSFSFDSLERLKEFTNPSGISTTYRYYANGLRATKQENNLTTHYVYLNGKVIEELDDKGNVTAQNIWGNQLLFRKDAASNKSGYYLYNSHGDVDAITDVRGETLNRYEYDSWGNIVSQQEAMSNPFKYTGEMYDNESKLYYLRARYYDPSVGRFISEDTYKGQVDNPLSLNRYVYTQNNPINFIDPTGHWCESKDGKWAHAGNCTDKRNNKSFEADFKHDGDFIREDGEIVGIYNHIEGAREDIALEVNTFLLFAPLPKFLGGGKAAASGKVTGTVWDSIKATQALNPGTVIPKSFELTIGSSKFWVHPNATKHMVEYSTKTLSHGSKMSDQALLTSFQNAVSQAIRKGLKYDELVKVGNWELIFSRPRDAGLLPVIKHAVYIP